MNMQGIFVAGILKGMRPGREWDGKIQNWEIGVSVTVSDGFGGHTESQELIRVSETQKAAVENAVNKLRGKPVMISVTAGAYAGRKGADAYLVYVPDSPIVSLDDIDPFTGESLKTPGKAA